MSYLFGFSGRINRAKMWLFIVVTLVWEIVTGLVAVFGLGWSRYLNGVAAMKGATPGAESPFPWPDPVSGPGWAVVGVIALLVLLYVVALLAVYTKRLHDRNKSAWWLILFLVIPWGVPMLAACAVAPLLAMGEHFGPLGVGLGVAQTIGGILGLWAFIELFLFRGTVGENRYGPDPLAK